MRSINYVVVLFIFHYKLWIVDLNSAVGLQIRISFINKFFMNSKEKTYMFHKK